MTNKEIKIAYQEFESLSELEPKDRELAQASIDATAQAYAPYSKFNVGAAVHFEDGVIVKGANQENAAYPSGLCAERTALFYASASRPDKAMTAIAIAAGQNGQLLEMPATLNKMADVLTRVNGNSQMASQCTDQLKSGLPMKVLLVGAHKIWKFEKIDDLLPLIFDSI